MKDIPIACLQYYVRHFPINKGKNRLINYFWKSVSHNQYQRETTLLRVPINMTCDLTKFIQRQIYFFGGYEEESLDAWKKLSLTSKVIFDVGANVGIYSLVAAATNSKADVHSFEPTPEMFELFAGNIELNSLKNIVANKTAVGRRDGAGFVHECKGGGNDNEGMNFVTQEETESSDQQIPVRSIESYCRENQIDRIDLLKIDIEGGEYDALLGAEQLLQTKSIDFIFIELIEWAANRFGHSTIDIKCLLSSAGYHLYELSSRGLTPINKSDVHQGSTNVIACAREPQSLRTNNNDQPLFSSHTTYSSFERAER